MEVRLLMVGMYVKGMNSQFVSCLVTKRLSEVTSSKLAIADRMKSSCRWKSLKNLNVMMDEAKCSLFILLWSFF